MGYSTGYPIPTVPWDGIGMGPPGHTIPTKRYGTAHGSSGKLSLLRLAHYLNRLSLLLGLHNILYLLTWYRYGIRRSDTIPFHGIGLHPYIPYHPMYSSNLITISPKLSIKPAHVIYL